MATISKRMTKSGVTYRIQVKVMDKGSGAQKTHSTTWKPAPGMTQRQIDREVAKSTGAAEAHKEPRHIFGVLLFFGKSSFFICLRLDNAILIQGQSAQNNSTDEEENCTVVSERVTGIPFGYKRF